MRCHNLQLQIFYIIFLLHVFKDLEWGISDVFIIELSRDWIIQFLTAYNYSHNFMATLCKKQKILVRYEITQPVSEFIFLYDFTHIFQF
jgi:hypothetical protein